MRDVRRATEGESVLGGGVDPLGARGVDRTACYPPLWWVES